MASENKSILIKSNKTPSGSQYKWQGMGDFIKEFTSNIDATFSSGEEGKKPNISHAVSGLPSAYARASMFAYAMKSKASDGKAQGLDAFYSMLLDEWKGFIASFVLGGSASFNVKRVKLNYSTGDGSAETTDNIYEPKGAFGNVLFGKKQLWEDQNEIGDEGRILKPFIDIIYFNNKVVGATSPESLVFTSPGYIFDIDERNYIFIGETSGKFTDPLNAKGKVSANELSELIVYVNKLAKKLTLFYQNYGASKHLLPENIDQSIGKLLSSWIDDMKTYAVENNIVINEEVSPSVDFFELDPFKSLFNVSNSFYADIHGLIYKDSDITVGEDYTEFKVSDLLLDDKTTILARIEGDEATISECPIHLFKVQTASGNKFFTIPLSELGLKIFQRNMTQIISGKIDSQSTSLTGIYDPISNVLNVTLDIRKKDGSQITKLAGLKYQCNAEPVGAEQLIIWPNFVSKLWNKYYMFSEMPHNNPSGWQAFPILGDTDEYFNLFDREHAVKLGRRDGLPDTEFGFLKIAENGNILNKDLAKIIVGNIKNLSAYKYEIYESIKPFKGVELKHSGKPAGFVFLKFDGDASTNNVKNEIDINKQLTATRVGIDFGSNNTCIAYWDEISNNSELLEFKNRRVTLFSSDSDHNESNKTAAAASFEMLFFQNDEIMSNKIKSTLTIHDENRVITDGNINLSLSEVAKGGFMCYESNIAIEDSTPNRHILTVPKINDQKVMMVHSMKWNNDAKEESYKQAFLKAIMLQTYAELFMNQTKPYYPSELVWAYPSAMSASAIKDYSTKVWNEISDTNPLGNKENPELYKLNVAQGSKETTASKQGILSGNSNNTPPMGTMGMNPMGGGMNPMGGGMNPMGGGMGSTNTGSSVKILPLELPSELDPNAFNNSAFQVKFSSDFKACTEAMAVSNYAAKTGSGTSGHFSLGFDVGGSTTDILAITSVNVNSIGTPSLIKQSSIKIAAGMIADATKTAPGFKEVLINFADQKGWVIHGINNMNNNTVPFYYNQIVDRLNNPEELNLFYNKIAANCKPLMWLNLYLTGLSIFYSGMVARKLRTTTENNPDLFIDPLYHLTLNFYGKGARIFDWFKALDSQNAENYYISCFSAGYGPDANEHFRGGQTFKLGNFYPTPQSTSSNPKDDNVKTEVAKGLALKSTDGKQRGVAEANVKLSEIIGEDGYMLKIAGQEPIELSALMDINPSLIQRLGSELLPPKLGDGNYPRFRSFIEMFYMFANQNLDFDMSGDDLIKGINSLNIVNELKSDEGYLQAQKATEFDFVAPLIILQGQAFLKNTLMPKIQQG